MYMTMTKRGFIDIIRKVPSKDFTYEGLTTLYNSLIEYEADVGEINFDPIAICHQFTQYEDAIKACWHIGGDWSDMVDHLLEHEEYETAEENARDVLNDKTWLADCDDGTIVIDSQFLKGAIK